MDFDKLKNNFQIVIFLLWAIGSPTSFALVYQYTNNLWQALGVGVLILFTGILASLWTGLWERWTPRLVEHIDIGFQSIFSGYQHKYNKTIEFQHRSFDIKGFTTQGPYTLDLEDVFVELRLLPKPLHEASRTPIPTVFEDLLQDSHTIWKFLEASRNTKNNLVILGPPGCGKTTLLRNIAVTLANTRRKRKTVSAPNKIPVLLFLRDHAKQIAENQELNLADLVVNTLKPWPNLTPPPKWFENNLSKGNCLVMLDGLDEVGDDTLRKKTVAWVEKQTSAYYRNQFIISSRPYGYQSNPVNNVTVFEVTPLNQKQIEKFIDNWYLANEIKSQQRDDAGVRNDAKKGANDLLNRLRSSPSLSELAVNPLLLTLIATVHRYRSSLPGRRVELYAEICTVFLGRRQEAKGIEFDLTPAQKQRVLQPLAYAMMQFQVRELTLDVATSIIESPLERVSPKINPADFLKSMEQQSGLIIERENDLYAFSHKTFQEYLASVHILEEKLEDVLPTKIEEDWWYETIRLYSAQTDATKIMEACLKGGKPSVNGLALAMELEQEAREISPQIREKLNSVIAASV